MEVNLPTEHPSESLHKNLYQPRHREAYPYEDLIDRSNLQGDTIRKTNSDDLRCNFPEEEDHQEGPNIDDGRGYMVTQSKYTDHFRGDIFFCDQRRSTGDEECADEIRDQESFIFFLESREGASSETFLTDESLEFMLSYRHEGDLGTSEKCERKDQREKYDKGYGVQGKIYYRVNEWCRLFTIETLPH